LNMNGTGVMIAAISIVVLMTFVLLWLWMRFVKRMNFYTMQDRITDASIDDIPNLLTGETGKTEGAEEIHEHSGEVP